jgi:hypothetical protein
MPCASQVNARSAAEADASAHCRNGCLCRRTDAIVGSLPAARLRRLQGYWREGVQDVFLWDCSGYENPLSSELALQGKLPDLFADP